MLTAEGMEMKMLLTAVMGGIGYPLLEILYRGRSHKSMALAGAVCLPVMRLCARMPCNRFVRALAAASCVTAVEGLIGACCNRDHQIWDYRGKRCNVQGQVCLEYCILWYALSWALVFASRTKRKR